MIDAADIRVLLRGTPLEMAAEELIAQAHSAVKRHGDLLRWQEAVASLPKVTARRFLLDNACVTIGDEKLDSTEHARLEAALCALKPWRKGPFCIHGITIDTEWHSDWKWARLAPHLQLDGRRVLDVGCGNGYYMLRAIGAGAASVLGIDPTPLYLAQFSAICRMLPPLPVAFLALGLEALPRVPAFDLVLSMGVIYHRRDPLDHLHHLHSLLTPGGQVVIESLVIPGDEDAELNPERYARMGNVHTVPSVPRLLRWLHECGFQNARCVDYSVTTLDEQRTTAWMTFESLRESLDPMDLSRTVEGHPAPQRAIILACKP